MLEIKDLKDGMEVLYRIGRTSEHGTRWQTDDWEPGRLDVQVRDEDLPKKYRQRVLGDFWHKGDPVTIGIKGLNWAEYGPWDYSNGRGMPTLLCEDYILEFLPLGVDPDQVLNRIFQEQRAMEAHIANVFGDMGAEAVEFGDGRRIPAFGGEYIARLTKDVKSHVKRAKNRFLKMQER